MIIQQGLMRVTVTLDAEDVDLMDRLARLEGSNRSAEIRSILQAMRPTLKTTIEALEAAERTKQAFHDEAAKHALSGFTDLMPELEKLNNTFLGALSRLEGAAAADPRSCNHGGQLAPPPLSTSAETPDDLDAK